MKPTVGSESVRHRRRAGPLLASGLSALAVAVTLGACGGTASTDAGVTGGANTIDTTPVATGGTFRLARSLEPVNLNPFTCSCENGSLQTMVQVYDTLAEQLPGSSEPQPGLAKSWDVSADKKTYTFHLRQARFSDGTPVTAADVKYSLDRANNPKSFYASMFGLMKQVSTPDASTVVVRLKQPTLGFPYYVAFPAASIVPKAALEKAGDRAFEQHPIGSGAFMVKRWVKGQVVELVRNPHYWRRGQPYLDEVKLLYVPNDNTRTLDLLSGNADAVDAVPFSQVDQVESSGQARVLFQTSSGMYNIWFNERYKPLNETGVRQALNYATPLREIQRVVFGGRAEIANANAPKLKYWSASVRPYDYDLDKARALIARSSEPDGFDLTIELAGGDDTSKQVAQIVQDAWGKIGVDVKLRQFDYGTLFSRMLAFQEQAFIQPPDVITSDIPIPDEFAQILFSTYDSALHNGFTWYRNPAATELAQRAIHATDEAEQAELWARLQRVTMEDPATVPLIFPPTRAAYRDDVHGYQYVPQTGWWRLEQVSLER